MGETTGSGGTGTTAGPRPDDVSMMVATAGARQPVWYFWLNPLIGVVGVWFGTRKLRE